MDQHDIIILRSLAGRYPIRFLGVITGISTSTINRFINGADAKMSTVLKLIEVLCDGSIDSRYRAYKADRTTKV